MRTSDICREQKFTAGLRTASASWRGQARLTRGAAHFLDATVGAEADASAISKPRKTSLATITIAPRTMPRYPISGAGSPALQETCQDWHSNDAPDDHWHRFNAPLISSNNFPVRLSTLEIPVRPAPHPAADSYVRFANYELPATIMPNNAPRAHLELPG